MAKETPEERRKRHANEVDDSQRELRKSIKKTQDLLDASDEMIERHRKERSKGVGED